MKLEYEIKGVKLNTEEIVAIHEYYRHATVAEYIMEAYKIKEDAATDMAAEIIHLIDHRDYTENEAISAVINKYVI